MQYFFRTLHGNENDKWKEGKRGGWRGEEVTRIIRRSHDIPCKKEKVGRKELAERVWEEVAMAYDRHRGPNCVILFPERNTIIGRTTQ